MDLIIQTLSQSYETTSSAGYLLRGGLSRRGSSGPLALLAGAIIRGCLSKNRRQPLSSVRQPLIVGAGIGRLMAPAAQPRRDLATGRGLGQAFRSVDETRRRLRARFSFAGVGSARCTGVRRARA